MNRDVISKIENEVSLSLKDFQKATVDRVVDLFCQGQRRVLVADEVGLGKTFIAKGVIAKLVSKAAASNEDHFKVVYICSNQNIAHQNIRKLDLFRTYNKNVSAQRLSLQFKAVKEYEMSQKGEPFKVQLLTLTPETSFKQSNGTGTITERNNILAVLHYLIDDDKLSDHEKSGLKGILRSVFLDNQDADFIPSKFVAAELAHDIVKILRDTEYDDNSTFKDCLYKYLNNNPEGGISHNKHFIGWLRKQFAIASVEMLSPDLVIMDEFQRFRFMISPDEEDSELSLLTQKFIKGGGNGMKILLLSATPYKLFSTLEEIETAQDEDHYSEFTDVIHFLKDDESKIHEFNKVWSDYSISLNEVRNDKTAILTLKEIKSEAEKSLYDCICRTERIAVMEDKDFIDDSTKSQPVKVTCADIKSYIEARKAISLSNKPIRFTEDYIKSSPYVLSYMGNYDAKRKLETYLRKNPEDIVKTKSDFLWIKKSDIENYKEIASNNARLSKLLEDLYSNGNHEMYLWVPPSMPYYTPSGVYRNSEKENFSKTLVFSAWEMVPKMIATMVSYNEETRTVGKLIGRREKEEKFRAKENGEEYEKVSRSYFKKNRFPNDRLKKTETNVLYTLLYPCATLASIYSPRFGEMEDIKAVEGRLRNEISKLTRVYREKYLFKGHEDAKWYWMIPIMMDIDCGNLSTYDSENRILSAMSTEFSTRKYQINTIDFSQNKGQSIGRIPDDLEDVLVNMCLGSPAVCLYRNLKDIDQASKIAEQFVSYFNTPEKTAIVELANNTQKYKDNDHWQNVLLYCKNGNLQAVIDEFIHLRRGEDLYETFSNSLSLRTASFQVESYEEFRSKLKTFDIKDNRKLRTHFAVAFTDTKDEKGIVRKDTIRESFNSPFWPFVLASTSIGQEGLDFHAYCRKVMHWNLPSNPIDIEQREGRVNRFKCLAIRQSIAKTYSNKLKEDCSIGNVWNDLFDIAVQDRSPDASELIPYWCLGDKQEVKIERVIAPYPFSKDESRYERLIKILSLYRLTLGQPRQEELLDSIFKEFDDDSELKNLFINLSPIKHRM
ncbi:MAG: DEAD/DEAH box helicase [Bacteroidaceae bacterium]|nr:DEAD/DEAH box helicase [Bacteroidaceae bacterium]